MKHRQLSPLEKFAERCTQGVGSASSLVVHTILFIVFFVLGFLGFEWSKLLLVLTTVVSLEAIYLAILIQISVNRNTRSLEEVEEDIDEIQEDVGEIEESLEEIQFDSEEEDEEDSQITAGGKGVEQAQVASELVDSQGDIQNIR